MNEIVGWPRFDATLQMSSGDRVETEIVLALDDAHTLAIGGAFESARLACAEVIAVHQARLAREPRLLAMTIATLAVARGFRSIARLLAATANRSVKFDLVAHRCATLATSTRDDDGQEHIAISEPWLDHATAVRQWSEQLVDAASRYAFHEDRCGLALSLR